MIKSLTVEQTALLEVYKQKGRAVGLNTQPVDLKKLPAIAAALYTEILKREVPELVVLANGPLEGFRASCVVTSGNRSILTAPVEGVCRIDAAALKVAFEELAKTETLEFSWPYLDGQFWAGWHAYYDYIREVLGIELPATYDILKSTADYGLWYTLDKVCIVTTRPEVIHMTNDQLHCETGPSVQYTDGSKVYSLHGVRVPDWLVMTPRHKLDPHEFAKLQNAEVRREFIRKVGVEQLCMAVGAKVVDSWTYNNVSTNVRKWLAKQFGKDATEHPDSPIYELVIVDLGGTTGLRPYLKMLNPSIGVWHMECVGKECKTVADAMTFRNGTSELPEVLT